MQTHYVKNIFPDSITTSRGIKIRKPWYYSPKGILFPLKMILSEKFAKAQKRKGKTVFSEFGEKFYQIYIGIQIHFLSQTVPRRFDASYFRKGY